MTMNDWRSCFPISWMVQMLGWFRADAARLAPEAFKRLLVPRQFIGQKLQGNEPAKLGVLGFVDHAHAAAAQLLNDAVMRDGLANKL
jgi:hypothetical protein